MSKGLVAKVVLQNAFGERQVGRVVWHSCRHRYRHLLALGRALEIGEIGLVNVIKDIIVKLELVGHFVEGVSVVGGLRKVEIGTVDAIGFQRKTRPTGGFALLFTGGQVM